MELMKSSKAIRKEVAIRTKELIASGVNANVALNKARQEANTTYGKEWREHDWKGDGQPMDYFPWMGG
jgi:hypothetical protein